MFLKIYKLYDTAKIPTRNNPNDAGLDIFSNEDRMLYPGYTAKIRTGICIQMTLEDADFFHTYAGFIYDRSSLGSYGIGKLAGVIDQDYTGEIMVCLTNHGREEYVILAGDKIAQIIFQKVEKPTMLEVDSFKETTRGGKGFGSSGK